MYPKYTTEGFIVGVDYSRESDGVVQLFTKDFGMISAHAKSVRLEKSKLRPNLLEGNFAFFSLVKGRDVWRLTDIELSEKISFEGGNLKLFLKILSLCKKLIHGEEKNEGLFLTLKEIFVFLHGCTLDPKLSSSLECVAVARMLGELGYGREAKDWGAPVFGLIDEKFLLSIYEHRGKIIQKINKSLSESHL